MDFEYKNLLHLHMLNRSTVIIYRPLQALVDLAADKNLYIPDTTNNPSSLDNNNSEKSTPYYK